MSDESRLTRNDLLALIEQHNAVVSERDTLRAQLKAAHERLDWRTAASLDDLPRTVDDGTMVVILLRERDSLRAQLATVTAERDRLRGIMPACSGTWLKGSGGHRVYARDCSRPGVWDVGGQYVCDEHKSKHGGDADAWQWHRERDALYKLLTNGNPDALECAMERTLIAQAERDAALARAEKAERELDEAAEAIASRIETANDSGALSDVPRGWRSAVADDIRAGLWRTTKGPSR